MQLSEHATHDTDTGYIFKSNCSMDRLHKKLKKQKTKKQKKTSLSGQVVIFDCP